MSLKIKTIVAICISIVLVGLAVLVWAYQTGRVTIFGSEQTSNVTYEVKGAELSKGTADANIDLSQNKIQLKRNGITETGEARLEIIKRYYGGGASYSETPINQVFLGLQYDNASATAGFGNTLQNFLDNVAAGDFSSIPLKWFTKDESYIQGSYPVTVSPVASIHPEVKFFTDNGKSLGNLYLQINNQKERYLGVIFLQFYTNDSNANYELYIVALGQNPSDLSKVNAYPYKLGEIASSIGDNANFDWVNWYNEKFLAWLPDKPFDVVIAESPTADASGKPHLLWQGADKGEYLGYSKIWRPAAGTYTHTENKFREGFITSTGLINFGNPICSSTDSGGFGSSHCLSIQTLLENSPKVFAQAQNYADTGIYQYSTGNSEVTKYNTFEPINPILPENSKITYRFSGSSDNTNWSAWSEAMEIKPITESTQAVCQKNTTPASTGCCDTGVGSCPGRNHVVGTCACYNVQPQTQGEGGAWYCPNDYTTEEQTTSCGTTTCPEGSTQTSTKSCTLSEPQLLPVDLSQYIPADSKYFKVEIALSKGTDTPSLEGFKINYDINGTVPPNTDPSNAGQVTTSETGSSNIATLVSTGSLLWVNILIALIFGGLITWLLVRKPSK